MDQTFSLEEYNGLAARLFCILADHIINSDDIPNTDIAVGVCSLMLCFGFLSDAAAAETAECIKNIRHALTSPLFSPCQLFTAVGCYTPGKNLNKSLLRPNLFSSSQEDAAAAMDEINQLIYNETQGNLYDVMPTKRWTNSKLIIACASKFIGDWDRGMDVVEPCYFNVSLNEKRMIQYIEGELWSMEESTVGNTIGGRIFRLKFANNGGWFVIVLPNNVESKNGLLHTVNMIDWSNIHKTFEDPPITKFKMPMFSLKGELSDVQSVVIDAGADATRGLSYLVDESRNLTHMWDTDDFRSLSLEISTSSKIQVDEKGFSSEAVTEALCSDFANTQVMVDKPFAFASMTDDGLLIDMGFYMGPK